MTTTIRVNRELHERLKGYAGARGAKIQPLVERILKQWLDRKVKLQRTAG